MADAGNMGTSCLKLTVARDKMAVYLTISEPEGWYVVNKEDIMTLLAANRVVAGIREDLIDSVVDNTVYNAEMLVAEGKTAVQGQDGRVEYKVHYTDDVAPVILPDGRADYKNMNLVHAVSKGDLLCVIRPPTAGEPGYSVLGSVLVARPGRPAPAPRGRNITVSPDGLMYYAAVDGQYKRSGANMDILEEFQVQKDVDFSTGNIKFTGSVTVRGNVMSGFLIESGGDVVIYGLVEKANVKAAGNIVLHGGMVGQGTGSLRAGGDIYAKYVENAILDAGGKVTAECIMHSKTRAGAGVELIGRKGLLLGGVVKARDYVKAGTIGSSYSTPTVIELGSDPKQNDRLNQIVEELRVTEEETKKARQAVDMLVKMRDAGKLTKDREQMLIRASAAIADNDIKTERLRAEHDGIQLGSRKNQTSFVNASATIFVGSKITIGGLPYVVKEDLQYCSLKSDGDEVRVGAY